MGFGIGVSNIILASVSVGVMQEKKVKRRRRNLSVSPLLAPDGEGGYFTGASLNIIGW